MKPNSFYGLKIVESVYLVEQGEPYAVRRTWRERLFTRPWRPWLNMTMVTPMVPYKGALKVGDTLLMHPETLRAMKRETTWPA